MESLPHSGPTIPEHELVTIPIEQFRVELEAAITPFEEIARLEEEREELSQEQESHRRVAYNAAEVAGKRKVTDPYSPEPVERPGESVTMQKSGALRLIGRVAREHTVHAEDFNENRARDGESDPVLKHDLSKIQPEENTWLEEVPAEDREEDGRDESTEVSEEDDTYNDLEEAAKELGIDLPSLQEAVDNDTGETVVRANFPPEEAALATHGLFNALRNIVAERRNRNQAHRRGYSIGAEKFYGTNVGRGKKATFGTAFNRFTIWKRATDRYFAGEISAEDRKDMINDWSHLTRGERKELHEMVKAGTINELEYKRIIGNAGVKYTSPTAVRRRVRKERLGAAVNHALSQRPLTNAMLSDRIDSVDQRIQEAHELQGEIYQDLADHNDERIREAKALAAEQANEFNLKGIIDKLGDVAWIAGRLSAEALIEASKVSVDEVMERHKNGQPVSLEETIAALSSMRHIIGAEALARAFAKDKLLDEHTFTQNAFDLIAKGLEKGRDAARKPDDDPNDDEPDDGGTGGAPSTPPTPSPPAPAAPSEETTLENPKKPEATNTEASSKLEKARLEELDHEISERIRNRAHAIKDSRGIATIPKDEFSQLTKDVKAEVIQDFLGSDATPEELQDLDNALFQLAKERGRIPKKETERQRREREQRKNREFDRKYFSHPDIPT